MILEEYISQFPVKPSSIVLDYGTGARSEVVDIPSARWDELKQAEKDLLPKFHLTFTENV